MRRARFHFWFIVPGAAGLLVAGIASRSPGMSAQRTEDANCRYAVRTRRLTEHGLAVGPSVTRSKDRFIEREDEARRPEDREEELAQEERLITQALSELEQVPPEPELPLPRTTPMLARPDR